MNFFKMKTIILVIALSSFSSYAKNNNDCVGILKFTTQDGTITRVPFAILDYKIDDPSAKTMMLRQNGLGKETSLTDGDEPNSYKFIFNLEDDQQLVGTLKINQLDTNLSSVNIKAESVIHGDIAGTFLGAYSCTNIKL